MLEAYPNPDGTYTLKSDFSRTTYNLRERIKKLGGRWDAGSKAWVFDPRDEVRVRELCAKIYGTDGSAPVELLTIRAPAEVCDTKGGGAGLEAWLAGRQVARAFGRDSGAKLGEGVVLVSGGFSSGGSVKNCKVTWKAGTVFEIRDVPRALAEKVHAEHRGVALLDTTGAVVAEATREDSLPVLAEEAFRASHVAVEDQIAEAELMLAAAQGSLYGLRFRRAELLAEENTST